MTISFRSLLLMVTLIACCCVVSISYFRVIPEPYHEFLASIEGVDDWFRVGTYSLDDNGDPTIIDLFYFNSDMHPDDYGPGAITYPNSFSLHCVWQTADGKWNHQAVLSGSRVAFHKIVSNDGQIITLQLRPSFRVSLDDLMHKPDVNKPFEEILTFKNGIPVLISEEQGLEPPVNLLP